MMAGIAALYVAAAKLGFTLAFAAEQVSVVWPPTGLAIAAIFILGLELWPGVFLGAFLANITSHEPILSASAIAAGNTLEAVVAVLLIRRIPQFENGLGRIRDVAAFVVVAGVVGTAVSATI